MRMPESRRLQPVLRASNRRATCVRHLELCRKLRLLGLCLFSFIHHRGRRDRREKPGIEEQHNALRLTRITQNRSQRFFSLRSSRQSKVWGLRPRIERPTTIEPAKRATAVPDYKTCRNDSAVAWALWCSIIVFHALFRPRRFLGIR